jgi:adenylate cyclase, class 2
VRESGLAHSPTETEVKIRLADLPAIQQRLEQCGFVQSVPRLFEANTIYDRPDAELLNAGLLLRLRTVGDRCVVTWKGQKTEGRHKSRPELETEVGSCEILHGILTGIGFQPSFRYEKFRTEYQETPATGTVTVDETPIGLFLELEGEPDWIDATALRLGYSPADYVLDSYGKLYLAECEKRGVSPDHMVF